MWYRSSANSNNRAVLAQIPMGNLRPVPFRQIDSEYYGYFDGSRLVDIFPVAINGQPVDISKVVSFERSGDNILFHEVYPATDGFSGQNIYRTVNVPKSILESYLSQNLKNSVGKAKSLQQLHNEMKQEERTQKDLYSEITKLADDYLSKNYTKDQIKKNFQYKIFDLFQAGKISQQTGDYLYAWMVKYVDNEAKPVAFKKKNPYQPVAKQQVYEGMNTEAIHDKTIQEQNEQLQINLETPPPDVTNAIKKGNQAKK